MRSLYRWMVASIIGATSLGLANASEVTASTMKYSNDGAYAARFYVQYRLDDGEACWVKPKHMSAYVEPGGWIKYGLDDGMRVFLGPNRCLDSGSNIPANIEVWGKVKMDWGEGESCRKNKRVIYKSSGGLVSYKTKGTTHNGNRCRVIRWPD